jgi:hypothetical protein
MNKVLKPRSVLIEKVAGELAATFYEIGRSQGLTSKHKNARAYARANLEKFIPKAIEHLIECLGPKSTLPVEAKEEIYNELMERVNDPANVTSGEIANLPDIDIKKLLDNSLSPLDRAFDKSGGQSLEKKREPALIINIPKPVSTRH